MADPIRIESLVPQGERGVTPVETEPLALLEEPMLFDDPISSVELLLLQMRQDEKGASRVGRVQARRNLEHRIGSQVDAMEKQARREFTVALIQAGTQAVQGGFTAVSGAVGLSERGAVKSLLGPAAQGDQHSSLALGQIQRQTNNTQLWLQAGGQLAAAGGTAAGALGSASVGAAERDVTRAEGQRELAQHDLDDAQSDLDEAREDARRLLDAIEKLVETEQQAKRAALFRA